MANLKVIQPGGQPMASDLNQLIQGFMGQADLDLMPLAAQIATPSAPSVTPVAGGVLSGTYKYQLVYVTGWVDAYYNMYIGGLVPSSETTITLTNQNAIISISSFSAPVIAILVYRTAVGGAAGTEKYCGIVMVNNGTAYVDSLPDSYLGNVSVISNSVLGGSIPASVPTLNTTGSLLQLGSKANSNNGNQVMSLLTPATDGVGLDMRGNIKVNGPSSIGSGASWNIYDKNNSSVFAVLIDGTKTSVFGGNLSVTGAITGSSTVQGTRFISTQATGIAPFSVTSTTAVPNLNADMVDGYHMNQDVRTTGAPSFAGLTVAGQNVVLANASCNKNWNWSGQTGQPSWLWGGNDSANMYVYNPSNFNVASVGGYGASALAKYADFASSTNGYQKLPSGIILQWGSVQLTAGTAGTATFPIAFPTNCVQAFATPQWWGGGFTTQGWSTTGVTLYVTGSGTVYCSWFAIGY